MQKPITTGERIKFLRQLNKIRQIDLANKIGVSRSLVAHWENDLKTPTREIYSVLAEALNTNELYLMGTYDHSNPFVKFDVKDYHIIASHNVSERKLNTIKKLLENDSPDLWDKLDKIMFNKE